jgi:hypothetical protein
MSMRRNFSETPEPTPTAEQLRRDIDRGMTGDKVPADDPATAPLGTDDEAAGTTPSPSRIARAILQETSEPQTENDDPAPGAAWILIAVALGILTILLLVWALGR